MRRFSPLLLVLLTLPVVSLADKTVTEITKSTTTFHDTRPNSDAVPDVLTLPATFERVVVLRVKFQADLLEALQQGAHREGIRNGVILSGIGSVRGYHYHVVCNRDFPSKNLLIRDAKAPADILGMNGYIIDGRVHAHLTLADRDQAFGGHLEPGTHVFTFAAVTVGVLPDASDLRYLDDKTYR